MWKKRWAVQWRQKYALRLHGMIRAAFARAEWLTSLKRLRIREEARAYTKSKRKPAVAAEEIGRNKNHLTIRFIFRLLPFHANFYSSFMIEIYLESTLYLASPPTFTRLLLLLWLLCLPPQQWQKYTTEQRRERIGLKVEQPSLSRRRVFASHSEHRRSILQTFAIFTHKCSLLSHWRCCLLLLLFVCL